MHSGSTPDEVASFYRDLGSRIRRNRADRLTQQMLAEKVGLSRAAVANIELGRQGVAAHMLPRFAAALGIEPADLLPEGPFTTDNESLRVGRLGDRDRDTVLRVLNRARREGGPDA